ncbi:MAG TPA: alkaline phosphatase [Syntrophales bacterium]|nr:alkaline phosphatase [Syntrophales bacterium]HOX93819.1 alkaline phosphatase [Syntrophales bacterium]HPI57741.1 alkaline phosphatase [Syntrophales bacterium]HPN25849.1 alkaline phosphatase [Syntrophales bacterium]HQM30369.1 alkaline phosphatase [Syntrophales bacterium]
MHRFVAVLLWTVCIVAWALPVAAFPADERPLNIVLIGWDGARRDRVRECLERNQLPNLKRLSSEGRLVAIDILRTTDTKSGWAQILTGYSPEITGVFSNSRYRSIPKGYTVFERLESHFGPEGIVTIAAIAKKDNLGAGPGEPYFHAKGAMDLFVNGLGTSARVVEAALEQIRKNRWKRFFLFVHFAETDYAGHRHGEDSKAYSEALGAADEATGRIIGELRNLGLYEKTLVYVTADHGFDVGRTSHDDAPFVFLATNDRAVMRRGERSDIAPTILHRFGVDTGIIRPPITGQALTEPFASPLR